MNRGHIEKINDYFSSLADQGCIIDTSLMNQSQFEQTSLNIGKVINREILSWKVQEPGESNFTEYTWELFPIDGETMAYLETNGISTDGWWQQGVKIFPNGSVGGLDWPGLAGYRSILLPVNENALEVHNQLRLRLPEGYTINAAE